MSKEIAQALATIYGAFYCQSNKRDRQFDAMDEAAKALRKARTEGLISQSEIDELVGDDKDSDAPNSLPKVIRTLDELRAVSQDRAQRQIVRPDEC